ncbi:hypothetical protein [Caulobacter radicis]|uniref:Outer membrane protein beta-barrel domain-containing protein n=1 Tax=Caulobacter radicis TaxID=2172650 RepID=A0A2T9K0X5_9CAUL|nr:hypothetical protein [Caulobacter radicis]PVM89590.1 hypothetical protein DDF65_00300 [Caulobacter radicis]
MIVKTFLGAAIAASSLFVAPAAWASGNEHVVDDAAVETPGVCHLEAWTTRFSPRQGLANLSPACTRKAWPRLELGAGLQHAWTADGTSDTSIGPALKLNLMREEKGLGLGLAGSATYGLRAGQLESASLLIPMTIPVSQRLRVNLNAGWSYGRIAARRTAVFSGAQVELGLPHDVTMMAEGFRRGGGGPGGQLGLRWNPGGGRFDLDLVAGRRIDGESPRAVSLGITWRR